MSSSPFLNVLEESGVVKIDLDFTQLINDENYLIRIDHSLYIGVYKNVIEHAGRNGTNLKNLLFNNVWKLEDNRWVYMEDIYIDSNQCDIYEITNFGIYIDKDTDPFEAVKNYDKIKKTISRMGNYKFDKLVQDEILEYLGHIKYKEHKGGRTKSRKSKKSKKSRKSRKSRKH